MKPNNSFLGRWLAFALMLGWALPASIAEQQKGPEVKDAAGKTKLAALRVKGTKIVTDDGKEIVLRGVNLGTWLLLETHFTGIDFKDEKSLWSGLEKRLTKDSMEKIREAYRSVWITAKDFERVRELGLNHVRVPFWYGLLEEDAKPGKYLDSGWKWLDNVVTWSEEAGIYCILDLHGAPGGQSDADHTGESGRR